MKYGELPKQPKPGVLLYCRTCHHEYSAYRGDYFLMNAADRVQCCDRDLVLVQKHRAPLHPITPADAEA